MNEYTPFTKQALANLRNPDTLQWYIIPLLAIMFYVYASEVEKKNWNLIFAGLAFWGADWINEIINSLVLHFSHYAPIWGTPGKSAFTVLIGLNVEIMFMFSIAGIVWSKMLPEDKNLKIAGINNRWFFIIAGSVFSVFIEYLLNKADMLTWDYNWWNAKNPWLIIPFGYMTFFIISFRVHDMKSRKKQIITVSALWGIVILSLIIFGSLGWI
ncbi:MAG: hypothetical protein GXO50_06170 [Chlorobi bacterium]|nr:hypothetical protein [Chlorobiota bacterium]